MLIAFGNEHLEKTQYLKEQWVWSKVNVLVENPFIKGPLPAWVWMMDNLVLEVLTILHYSSHSTSLILSALGCILMPEEKHERSRKLIINMLWFPFPAVAASQPGSFCKIGFCWKSAENLSAGINLHLHQSWKERKFWKLLCDWNFQFGMTWWFVASHICKYDSCCSTVPYMSRVNSRFGGGMVLTRDIKW